MTEEAIRIRVASRADAAVIARQRACMFADMGQLNEATFAPFLASVVPLLELALEVGTYHGWIAELAAGQAIAGAGIQLRSVLPRPELPTGGREALILNVYVEPVYRRRGLARRIMLHLLDWCRTQGIGRVVLHPSANARPLYESLGFRETGEMIYRNSSPPR